MNGYSELRKTDYKGRVTIPSRMFEELGMQCGDEVRIILYDDRIEIRPFIKDYNEASEMLMSSIKELHVVVAELREMINEMK